MAPVPNRIAQFTQHVPCLAKAVYVAEFPSDTSLLVSSGERFTCFVCTRSTVDSSRIMRSAIWKRYLIRRIEITTSHPSQKNAREVTSSF